MSETTAVDRMFDALARGDVDGARATCTPDARVWHSYDRVAHDLDSIGREWAALIAGTIERGISDIRRQRTPDGIVQQHLFYIRPAGGERKIWPVCVVARFENGLIARLDEYIDRAGSYASNEEPLETPGF
jgi:ketosteroid isomerase-like protein